MIMKGHITRLLTVIASALLLTACWNGPEDKSPVSILVGPGLNPEYLQMLADGVKKEHGIDVKYVYITTSMDGSNRLLMEMMHGKMPTDMALNAMRIDTTYANHECLDLMSYSAIASYYNFNAIQRCSSPDGAVYQLPLSSRLIGITYNATLMEEKGWEVPRSRADMVALKDKCRRAGVPFAYTKMMYTGHGFNYLFHLMGAQWLTSIEGKEWLKAYLNGKATVGPFEKEAAYFDRWVKDGLFGEICDDSYERFVNDRALLHFDILSHNTGHGKDRFKTMPWPSEDGSGNSFTIYDNVWVMASKTLLEPGKEEKLKHVGTILNYLMKPDLVEKMSSQDSDVYVDVADYEPDSTKLYADYIDEIRNGFTQPWYYNDFDNDAVVGAGEKINSYMLRTTYRDPVPEKVYEKMYFPFDPQADFHAIFTAIDHGQNGAKDTLFVATEEMDYRHTALLNAISGARELQAVIDRECPGAGQVEVALMPYATTFGAMPVYQNVAVQDMAIHKGPFYKSFIHTLISATAPSLYGMRMTGAEVQKLVDDKFDPSGYFVDKKTGKSSFDSEHYGPYPYALVTKGGMRLDPKKEYIVAVAPWALPPGRYEELDKAGRVLRSSDAEHHVLVAEIVTALEKFFEGNRALNPKSLVW